MLSILSKTLVPENIHILRLLHFISMEVLNIPSSATYFHSQQNSPWIQKERISKTQCVVFQVNKRKLVIAEAKKKNKDDFHSFVSKPDESTGPFPEAILLKQKSVQEDGRVLPEFEDADEENLFEFLNLQMESDLNLQEMRHYEVVYLIHEDHKDDVGIVNTKIEDFVRENKGRIWRFSDWGMRRLAYKIKKAKNAHYILMNFEIEASLINDFKSMLDKDERIIRHLVIKRDKAITENCTPPVEFHTLRSDMDETDDDEDEDDDMEYNDEEEEDDGDMVTVIDDVEDNAVAEETKRKKIYA